MAGSSRVPRIVLGLLLGIGLGITAWFWWHLPPPGPRPMRPDDEPAAGQSPLDRPTSLDLIESRNLALGLAENHKFSQAIMALELIASRLPVEPFAVRNLAIAHVKQTTESINERQEPDRFARALEESQAAVQKLEALEPETALPPFLRAVLATKQGDTAATISQLKLATQRDPNNAAWLFQWFELGRSLRDPADKQAAYEAGLSAAKLAPDNLFVQKEVLAESLFRLADEAKTDPDAAAAQSDDILAWLERFREPVRVLGISLQVQAKLNLVDVLDNVIGAVRNKNWEQARNEFLKIKNLLSLETAADADLIHPQPLTYNDPLNYLATDFSPAFYRRADLPDQSLPQIEVAWKNTDGVLPEANADTFALRWLDLDLDGVEDLATMTPQGMTVFRRRPDRTGWDAISVETRGRFTGGFAAADLDDDVALPAPGKAQDSDVVSPDHCHQADPDFVLYGADGVLLVNNVLDAETKNRQLELIPAEKAGFGNLRDVAQAKLVDFDHDGDLDLITRSLNGEGIGVLRLWINLGNFSFRETTELSIMPPENFDVHSFAVVDWDQDNDIDVLVSGEKASGWLDNLRHGRLRFHNDNAAWPSAHQLAVAEIDGQGSWDLVLSDDGGVRILFTEKPAGGLPVVRREERLAGAKDFVPEPFDFDNDGGLDLFTGDSRSGSLWRNDGRGKLTRQAEASAALPIVGELIATFADVDGDGDLDGITASSGELNLLANEGGNKNHWLNVRFRAQQIKANEQGASKRVNHYGIGNTVEVKTGTRYQAQIADGQTTRFGLGPAEKADILRVIMTNGVPQNRIDPKANELICERQILLSSCPYLYTWNGRRYEFVTDLIWASPLGLKASQTGIMPWRDWEYLKIDGRSLQPLDGEYPLQITEELWEVGFFDQVRLIAVDHPADVEIFTNEKVGSAEIAAHKIHTPRKSIPPRYATATATDQAGFDWKSALEQRDEQYARTFTRKLAQGLCEEHYLELHLDPMAAPRGQILLFLTGWVRPTDTNINVALDQNPELPSPTGLALWTPDAFGNWREVSPHVGFPNGKTKTIVIDLSHAFSAGQYRLRLVSNREFYWDQAFFTVDDESVEIREHELPLLKANLHYRGFSRGILPAGDGPETYDYEQLAALPHWPAMDGLFTRFGDVRPLLADRDDKVVAIGAGDEISLSFGVPAEPPPKGWVRDFVMCNVGWVKDCLLNTWEGQRVEPLPFAAMNDHDYWTGRPDDADGDGDYVEYLRTYQTRRQTTPFRNSVRRWSPQVLQTIPIWERNRRTGD